MYEAIERLRWRSRHEAFSRDCEVALVALCFCYVDRSREERNADAERTEAADENGERPTVKLRLGIGLQLPMAAPTRRAGPADGHDPHHNNQDHFEAHSCCCSRENNVRERAEKPTARSQARKSWPVSRPSRSRRPRAASETDVVAPLHPGQGPAGAQCRRGLSPAHKLFQRVPLSQWHPRKAATHRDRKRKRVGVQRLRCCHPEAAQRAGHSRNRKRRTGTSRCVRVRRGKRRRAQGDVGA